MRDSTRVCEVDGFGFHPGTLVVSLYEYLRACASIPGCLCVYACFAALVGFYVPEILHVHTSASFFSQVAG